MTDRIAVIPGDGIGGEVVPVAVRVLDAVGDFAFEYAEAGDETRSETGSALPDDPVAGNYRDPVSHRRREAPV